MRVRVIRLRPADRPAYQARVAALERLASYPLGDDAFQLDHGPDYFAFFDRLGRVETYLALVGERVVAMATGILRRVPFQDGGRPRRTWYLCDLKVDPELRGRRIPFALFRRAFPSGYLRCQRGYAISMNPPDRPNPVVRLAGHWRLSPIHLAGELRVYSLDAEQARTAAAVLRPLRGPLRFRSLRGKKDLILASTGRPLPLLHGEYGAAPELVPDPQPGTTHMVCAARGDPACDALEAAGLQPSATASLLAHRMPACDWRFVLTSEI